MAVNTYNPLTSAKVWEGYFLSAYKKYVAHAKAYAKSKPSV